MSGRLDKRTVNTEVLWDAIKRRDPMGVEKLAIENGVVTAARIYQALAGRPPKPISRHALAKAVGVEEAVLFPPARSKKRSA